MARQSDWWTLAHASGTVGVPQEVGLQTLTSSLVNPTVLRTRAYVGLATAATASGPFYPGNAIAPMVLRLLAADADSPPTPGWWENAEGYDDITFSPLIWNDGLYIPQSADMSRPEQTLANAYLPDGVVDVKSMRHFDGDVEVALAWFVGPAIGTGQVADPLFTTQLWFRVLIEATI